MADDRLYYRMGQMNYTGTGTDKDYEKAIAYLTESANLGNEYAMKLLQYINSIKGNNRWSAAVGVTRLFNHLSRILQDRLQEEQKGRAMTDRKLKRKIDEKKQEHGLRQG